MKVLVISHTYISKINRDKWKTLALLYPDISIAVIIPKYWPTHLFKHSVQDLSCENTKNCSFHTLKVYLAGNETKYFYSPIKLFNFIKKYRPDIIHVEQGESALSYLETIIFTKILALKTKFIFFTWVNWEQKKSLKYKLTWGLIEKINRYFSSGALVGNHDAQKILEQKGFCKPILVLPQLGINISYCDKTNFALEQNKTSTGLPAGDIEGLQEPVTLVQNKTSTGLSAGACKKVQAPLLKSLNPLEFTNKIIGFVGRITEEKGVLLLIEAFNILHKDYPDWKLLFVGNGSCKDKLLNYINKNSLDKCVTLIPPVNHYNVLKIIKSLSVLVLPSYDTPQWREQFGHVIIEAMANKVPVIGSNAGEIPNVIKDSGFIFKQKNIKSLLASLITLIQNEALRLELSEKGYKRVLNNYTHEVIAKKTYNFWVNINTQKSLDNFLGKYQEGEVMKKIAVVGAGYVGLVTGVCLATQKEYLVTIIENNEDKINKLLSGKVPFYEPGLDILLTKGIEQGNLIFVNNIKTALENNPEIIFSCVGTPSLPDGSADLSYVWNVSTEIGKNLNNYCIIVNKSTVPVGTGKKVQALILHQLNSRNIKIDFDVASNPEFLKEGDALNDFLKPDRIVIGTQSEKTKYILSQLYRPFVHNDNQFVFMNIESAELTKYASNAMLATKISFINQIALLADKVGANIEHIKQGMSKDIRIGPHFLNAGIGYGGSCFPKDVQALISMGSEYNQPMTLVSEVENINNSQRFWFSNKIINYYGSQISHKNLGIWGLAFKPETDDIRCAPSIDTLVSLLEKGANIYAYDPVASNNIKEIFGARIKYAQSAQEILKICDALAILTEWKEFKNFTPEYFTTLKDKLVFDGRNCFDPVLMFNAGINYMCIGNNIITHKTYTGVTTTKETHTIHPPKNPPIEPIPQ